jgi:hypothetical protein
MRQSDLGGLGGLVLAPSSFTFLRHRWQLSHFTRSAPLKSSAQFGIAVSHYIEFSNISVLSFGRSAALAAERLSLAQTCMLFVC